MRAKQYTTEYCYSRKPTSAGADFYLAWTMEKTFLISCWYINSFTSTKKQLLKQKENVRQINSQKGLVLKSSLSSFFCLLLLLLLSTHTDALLSIFPLMVTKVHIPLPYPQCHHVPLSIPFSISCPISLSPMPTGGLWIKACSQRKRFPLLH